VDNDSHERAVLHPAVYRNVERQLELAETVLPMIDVRTARTIAGALKQGEDGPLHAFARHGQLHPARALRELEAGSFDLLQVRWAAALITFLHEADSGTEPSPRVYVLRADGVQGRWIDLTMTEYQVENALATLTPGEYTADSERRIAASMGFGRLAIEEDADIWRLHHVARGIARHGEAYVAYAVHSCGLDLCEEEFERLYHGCMSSLEAFVLDRAEKQGWLKAINELNARFNLNGLVSVDVDEAARQYFAEGFWCRYPGTDGIHIFGPPTPPA